MCEITTEIECAQPELEASIERIRMLAERVCRRFSSGPIWLDLAVVDDRGIRRLKRQFFGRDETTDVVSFDLSEAGERERTLCIAVNSAEAERQARDRGHETEVELALYVVHGLLHQFGFDDADPVQAERMHQMEDRILEEEGFGIVYDRPIQDTKGSDKQPKG